MKSITIFLFVFSIQLFSQDYLNIHYTDDSYKYALISSIQKITFGAGGDQLIVLLTDESSTTDDLSTIGEITYDNEPLGDPLPVELASFTAELNGNIVTLFWTTETEVENYGFDVEHKMQDARHENREWKKIGFVEGHGNSNSPKEYSFVDDNPPSGTIQYRLKQIDTDGSYEYSDVVSIETGIPKDYELKQNFPNPFNPTTKIVYKLPVDGFVTIKVYNILSQEVASLVNENKKAGTHTIIFDGGTAGGGLSSGIYFLRLNSENYTGLIKMVLLR